MLLLSVYGDVALFLHLRGHMVLNWKLVRLLVLCVLFGFLGMLLAQGGMSLYADLRFLHTARVLNDAQIAAQAAVKAASPK